MKAPAIIFAVAIAPGAVADFWLTYMNKLMQGPIVLSDGLGEGGVFLKDPVVTCSDVSIGIWSNSGDVSGSKTGMRTVPGNPVRAPLYRDPLDIVEFNTGDAKPGHHTIYKDRNYAMVDVSGKVTGQCHLNRTHTFKLKCDTWGDPIFMSGSSMFFCESDIEL
ncbi:hypothetical protein F4804DRAFT_334618 [Jackrogersella minutella]|nr:hypothetical protein F4804DRAFT_334618 [Jackrogersella minutella]